jgi:hypothetical protein
VPNCESQRESVPTALHPGEEPARALAEKHSHKLLSWLQIELRGGRVSARHMRATELKSACAEMCEETGIACPPWNPLAASFPTLVQERSKPR